MKKDVQQFKSLYDYLNELSKEEFDELYQNMFRKVNNKRKQKEKIEEVYSQIMANCVFVLALKGENNFQELDDIIKGKQPKYVDQKLIDAYFVIKTDDGYTTFEEIKGIYEHSKSEEIVDEKKNVAFSYYIEVNGVLEKNKIIELMAKTNLSITEGEIEEYCRKNDYSIKEDLIYANSVAENLNINNQLIKIKEEQDYKIFRYEEITSNLLTRAMNDFEGKVENILSKKLKKGDVEDILYLVMTRVRAGDNYEDDVYELLTLKNIKLGKLETEFYALLQEYYYYNPVWSLNGHSPMELDNVNFQISEEDDERDFWKRAQFEGASKNEIISICAYAYVVINGAIELEDLLKIINDNYSAEISKNDLVKFIKKEPTLEIADDYVVIESIPKDYLATIIASKKLKNFYLIEDFDEFDDETQENDEKLSQIFDKYGLSHHLKDDIVALAHIGMFNEMVLEAFLEENAICLGEKTYSKLFNELKKCISNTRLWYLNGFKPCEVNSVSKKEKVGRNDPCPCGSGKKYKKCCGK